MFHSGTILQSCIASIFNCKELHAPLLPRADGKGGVIYIRGISANGGQPIVGNIVPDVTSERYGFAIIDGRGFNASSLELVNECMVVIGTHTSPARVTDLTIEYCY